MHLSRLTGIRAVLFDVYGTLLKSTAGDIHPDPDLRVRIEEVHATSPHPFPEVDIREIHARLHPALTPMDIERLAIEHENATNPVVLMPGTTGILAALAGRGIPLGLVSNAQFYTVPILEKCLGTPLACHGIDASLCCLSYEERRAKPDPHLFQVIRDKLAARGVPPECVLHVGNDVRNDIEPARSVGFRTALFTGDAASLRLHGRDFDDCGADLILPDLGLLRDLI